MIRNEPKQLYIYDHSLGRGTPIYATHDEKVTYSGEFSAIEYHAIEFNAYSELLTKLERVLQMLEIATKALKQIAGPRKKDGSYFYSIPEIQKMGDDGADTDNARYALEKIDKIEMLK